MLDDHKHVKFVMSGNTMDIEREAETISRSLSEASGLIVKIRMLEPHEINREFLTNVYVYAIDPKTNSVVEMEELQEWVGTKFTEVTNFRKFGSFLEFF